MSVSISLFRIPDGINSISEIPNDFVMEPLGSRDEVMAVIRALFPNADYSDPQYVYVRSDELTEIFFPIEDPVVSLGFRNPSFQLIQRVYETTGWRGLDPSDGCILPPFIPPERYGFFPSETADK